MRSKAMLAALAFALAVPATAHAKDTVPTRHAARAYFVRTFPAAAPTALLGTRGHGYHAHHLRVVKASRCTRNARQVACRFRVRLVHGKATVYCRGELWAKRRDGRLVARTGDYVCVT